MLVRAKKDNVSALHKSALDFNAFRVGRDRPLHKDQLAAIDRVSVALISAASDTIDINQTDLTEVHALSVAHARIACSPLRRIFQIHCIAAYLAVATPFLFYDLVSLLAAPVIVPFYFFFLVPVSALFTWASGGRLFGNPAIIFWIATHVMVRYFVFCWPSYFIARDLRYREFTFPAYVITAILLIGWPLYHIWEFAA